MSVAADTRVGGPDAPVTWTQVAAQALEQFGLRKLAEQQARVYACALALHRAGRRDFSMTEVRDEYERRYGLRIDVGRVSARVADLVSAGRLVRLSEPRTCVVTGYPVQPLAVPHEQLSFFQSKGWRS